MLFPPSNLHDRSGLPPLQQLLQQHHQQAHFTAYRGDMGRNYDDDGDESEEYNMDEDDDGEDDDLLEGILEGLPHGNYVAVLVSTTISALETTNQNNLLLTDQNIANAVLPPTVVTTELNAFATLHGSYDHHYPSSPLVESVLDECYRQLNIIARLQSSTALSSGVDGVFAKFWREFNQVVRNHPECHDRLIQFLGDFLVVVESEGRNWFGPKEKLGRGLFNRELRYWFDEVANDVLVYLKERDPLDDSALDHPTVKHFINYYSFLALLTDNFPDLRKWFQIFHLPQWCLLGRNDTDRPWRDAALLAWERVIDILGTRAYEEFRDQGWMDWETKAGEIGLEFIRVEARRNTIKQAAERIHLKMRKVREEANTAVMFPSYIFTTNSPFLGWPAVTCRAER